MRKPILLMLATALLMGCSSRSVTVTSPPNRTGTVVVVPEKETAKSSDKTRGKSAEKQPEHVKEKKAAKAEQKAEKAEAKAVKKSEKASGHSEKGNGKSAHAAAHAPRKLTGVPPGHYPPKGMCRVWYPGRAPGQQPKSTDCAKLRGKVPADAFVLYNGKDWDARYDWSRERKSLPAAIVDVLLSVNR